MKLLPKHQRIAVAALSFALYLASLFLPALLFQDRAPLGGAHVLAWGWWGALLFEFAWFANGLYVYAVWTYLAQRNGRFKWAAPLALVLALTSFFTKEWWFNEAGGTAIAGLGSGFYVWLASLLVLAVGSFMQPIPHHAPQARRP